MFLVELLDNIFFQFVELKSMFHNISGKKTVDTKFWLFRKRSIKQFFFVQTSNGKAFRILSKTYFLHFSSW